jgi:hypothetical protein
MSNLMDETVKEICDSMCKDPNRWQITTHTVNDKVSGVQYWLDRGSWEQGCITHTWNGCSRDEVFTEEQGYLIYQAYIAMKEHKTSEAQQKVINSVKPKPSYFLYEVKPQSKWWEFWK